MHRSRGGAGWRPGPNTGPTLQKTRRSAPAPRGGTRGAAEGNNLALGARTARKGGSGCQVAADPFGVSLRGPSGPQIAQPDLHPWPANLAKLLDGGLGNALSAFRRAERAAGRKGGEWCYADRPKHQRGGPVLTPFEEVLTEGEIAINRWIKERRQETVDLEFKTKIDKSNGQLTKKDKETLAQELSAFSNSAGGVIIFGVSARKDDEGVDCAGEAHPIAEIERFQSEVIRSVGELLMPRYEGIRVELIRAPNLPGSGYLAIQVDRSERRPHRSEAGGDKRYYKRAGSSSYIMEHYDIEDQFKRQERAKLNSEYMISTGMTMRDGNDFTSIEVILSMYLVNISAVTARFPYFHVLSSNPTLSFKRDGPGFPRTGSPAKGAYWFDGGADEVINPGISRIACQLLLRIDPGRRIRDSDIPLALNIEFRAGCEHVSAFEGTFSIPRGELNKGIWDALSKL